MRQMGDRLSDTWEKKWYQQGVEAKWEGLMRELKEEDVRFVACTVPCVGHALPMQGKRLRPSQLLNMASLACEEPVSPPNLNACKDSFIMASILPFDAPPWTGVG